MKSVQQLYNRKVTASQTIVPAFFVLFAIIINKYLMPSAMDMPPLELTLHDWDTPRFILRYPGLDNTSDTDAEKYANQSVTYNDMRILLYSFKSMFPDNGNVNLSTVLAYNDTDHTFEDYLIGNGTGLYDKYGRFYVDYHL
jgi:hypothetical protein